MSIKTDQDYFGAYFTLCEFFLQKRAILEKLWERVRKNTCDNEYWKESKELKEFEAVLQGEEDLFWQEVNGSLRQGSHFIFEDFARKNNLGCFEKKTVLFLLYANLHHPVCLWQANELVALLDNAATWDSKLRFHHALKADGPLFTKNILVLKPFKSERDYDTDIILNPLTRNALVELISGNVTEIPCFTREEEKPVESNTFLRDPDYQMPDVILSDKDKEKVLFHLDAWKNGMESLGIQEKIKKGRGSIFLFYGPPGTGKSMLADAIAWYLKKKILQVTMPCITDKLFGETEKNIANVFKAAKDKDAVICFDEADSLLYSRHRMTHERDIAFLNVMLQEIERFDGVMALTTNFDEELDPALERRVSLKIKFEPPDESLRASIWRSHVPSKLNIAGDVDFERLGKNFVMSGGYIKNAVFNALKRVAQEKRTVITMSDFLFGATMEQEGMFQKEHKGLMGFAG